MRASIVTVSDDDRAVLEAKPIYDAAASTLEQWDARVERAQAITERLRTLATELLDLPAAPTVPDTLQADLTDLRAELAQMFGQISESAQKLEDNFSAARDNMNRSAGPRSKVVAGLAIFETTYADVKERSSAHETQLAALSNLEADVRTAGRSLENQRNELRELDDAPATHKECQHRLNSDPFAPVEF